MNTHHTKTGPSSARWVIEGYNSMVRTFVTVLPGNFSEGEIITIVQRLTCRHLTDDEIVSASLRKSKRNALLEPQINSGPNRGRYTISVSAGRDYIASFWKKGETIPKSMLADA
jgi:hypothetical protein